MNANYFLQITHRTQIFACDSVYWTNQSQTHLIESSYPSGIALTGQYDWSFETGPWSFEFYHLSSFEYQILSLTRSPSTSQTSSLYSITSFLGPPEVVIKGTWTWHYLKPPYACRVSWSFITGTVWASYSQSYTNSSFSWRIRIWHFSFFEARHSLLQRFVPAVLERSCLYQYQLFFLI